MANTRWIGNGIVFCFCGLLWVSAPGCSRSTDKPPTVPREQPQSAAAPTSAPASQPMTEKQRQERIAELIRQAVEHRSAGRYQEAYEVMLEIMAIDPESPWGLENVYYIERVAPYERLSNEADELRTARGEQLSIRITERPPLDPAPPGWNEFQKAIRDLGRQAAEHRRAGRYAQAHEAFQKIQILRLADFAPGSGAP